MALAMAKWVPEMIGELSFQPPVSIPAHWSSAQAGPSSWLFQGTAGLGHCRQCRPCMAWIQPEQKGLANGLRMQILDTSQGVAWAALATCPTSGTKLGDCALGNRAGSTSSGGPGHCLQPGPCHQCPAPLCCPRPSRPLSGPRWMAHSSCTNPHRCRWLLPNLAMQSWAGESWCLS